MAGSANPASTDPAAQEWPGQRLGLPRDGAGSIARPLRRIVALCIDWGIAAVIAAAFFDYEWYAILGVYALSQIAGVATAGASIGHAVTGMRVELLGGGYAGLWRPVVRTLLICLVIPPVIWNADQRGAHDLVAQTILVRR